MYFLLAKTQLSYSNDQIFFPLYSTEKSQDEGMFDTPVTALYSGPKFPPYRQSSAHKRRRNFVYQV